jgi:hypothetical protein
MLPSRRRAEHRPALREVLLNPAISGGSYRSEEKNGAVILNEALSVPLETLRCFCETVIESPGDLEVRSHVCPQARNEMSDG